MRILGAFAWFMLVTLLLRSTALTALAARGLVFDVLAFATVVWALRWGESWGVSFGFALGLAADLDAAHWLGRHALALALIGYTVGRLSHTLVRDRARVQAVLILLATVLHQSWAACFEIGKLTGWPYVLERVAVAAVVTAPVGTFLLALVRRASGQPLFTHAAVEPGPTG